MRTHDQKPDAAPPQQTRSAPRAAPSRDMVARATLGRSRTPQDIVELGRFAGNDAVARVVGARGSGAPVQRVPSAAATTPRVSKEEAFKERLSAGLGGGKGKRPAWETHVASAVRAGRLQLDRFGGDGGNEALLAATRRHNESGSYWRSMGDAEFDHLVRHNALPSSPYGGLSPTRKYSAQTKYFSSSNYRYLVQFFVGDADPSFVDLMAQAGVGGKSESDVDSYGLGTAATPADSKKPIPKEMTTRPDGVEELQSKALIDFNKNLSNGQYHWFLDAVWVPVPENIVREYKGG